MIMTYAQRLKDPRWQKKRLELLNKAHWTCEECKAVEPADGLQIYHVFYMLGKLPWEHDDRIMMVLCDGCHKRRQKVEQEFFYGVACVLRWKTADEIATFPATWFFKLPDN